MLVPLYGFLEGDTVGLVVMVHDHQTIAELAEVLQQAAVMRVAPRKRVEVWAGKRRLDPRSTVAAAGLEALDRVDVRAESLP